MRAIRDHRTRKKAITGNQKKAKAATVRKDKKTNPTKMLGAAPATKISSGTGQVFDVNLTAARSSILQVCRSVKTSVSAKLAITGT